MKAATILPQPYLPLARNDQYHMALAHLLQADGMEEYSQFFHAIGQEEDKFLMMDTGLIEGDARPIEELVQKAHFFNVDEMVLLDVFENMDETLRESHDAMEYIMHTLPNVRMMAVPQGIDFDEWIECAKEMLTWPIHTIGIPKVLCKDNGANARLEALEAIQPFLGDKEVHLLGCWNSPLELKMIENYVRQGRIKPVRGVDSAIAYVYARAGIRITDDARPTGAIDFEAGKADEAVLAYNIEIWKQETAELQSIQAYHNNSLKHLI